MVKYLCLGQDGPMPEVMSRVSTDGFLPIPPIKKNFFNFLLCKISEAGIMNPHVPSPSFKPYQHFANLVSSILPDTNFFFLQYFKANLRHHSISPAKTSIYISNR